MDNTLLLKMVWRNAEVYYPTDIERPILYCTKNNKLGVFKDTATLLYGKPCSHWDWLKEKYSIKCWLYQDEIIPIDYVED